MILAALAALTLYAQAAPDAAAPPAADKTAAAQAIAAKSGGRLSKNGKICRKEKPIGSTLPVTVCYTVEEMEARTQADKDNLDKMQRQSLAPASR